MAQEKYQYEWYAIRVQYAVGWIVSEYKAKSREHAIKRITVDMRRGSPDKLPEIMATPSHRRPMVIVSVDWDSLTLDRVGYQRLF